MARVLIAGCGDVGCALAVRLRDAGHAVWGIRRTAATLPPGIQPLIYDLADRDAHRRHLPTDLDHVVYAAAPGARDRGETDRVAADRVALYRRAYLVGLGRLLDALASTNPQVQRVIFVSSTGVYGSDDGAWVDEDTPPAPARPTGAVLLEAEARLHASPFAGCALRAAGIYGPDRLALVRRALAADILDRGAVSWTNRIHRDDVAGALAHLLMRDEAPAPCYLAVDEAPAPRHAVIDWLRAQLGLPRAVDRDGATGDPSASSDRTRGANKRCDGGRLRATGYRFQHPTYREGYTAVLRHHADWLRDQLPPGTAPPVLEGADRTTTV
ncbi:MAG: SDR family oxidoreductase [Acidobacteriota bacterium]